MLGEIVKKVHTKLIKEHKTIAVAESCSGGLLSNLLTSLPGSSKYFLLGIIAYSNKSKTTLLNIPGKTIARYGAVSSQVAILMAKNIRKKSKSDFALSITGIAGPGGATKTKPVGTVFICLSGKGIDLCRSFSFKGNRQDIRKKSALEALRLLCAPLSL